MSRAAVTPQNPKGPYPVLQPANDSLNITFTAADASNKNAAPFTGHEFLLWQNTGSTVHTVTITSSNDSKGRSGDITSYNAANNNTVGGVWLGAVEGWLQSDGNVYFESNSAEVKFAVVVIPNAV